MRICEYENNTIYPLASDEVTADSLLGKIRTWVYGTVEKLEKKPESEDDYSDTYAGTVGEKDDEFTDRDENGEPIPENPSLVQWLANRDTMRWYGPFYKKAWDTYFFRTVSEKGQKFGFYFSVEMETEDIVFWRVGLESK